MVGGDCGDPKKKMGGEETDVTIEKVMLHSQTLNAEKDLLSLPKSPHSTNKKTKLMTILDR